MHNVKTYDIVHTAIIMTYIYARKPKKCPIPLIQRRNRVLVGQAELHGSVIYQEVRSDDPWFSRIRCHLFEALSLRSTTPYSCKLPDVPHKLGWASANLTLRLSVFLPRFYYTEFRRCRLCRCFHTLLHCAVLRRHLTGEVEEECQPKARFCSRSYVCLPVFCPSSSCRF